MSRKYFEDSKKLPNFAPATLKERCRSGRSGRSRKPLYPYGYPGFESLSFRKKIKGCKSKILTAFYRKNRVSRKTRWNC